MHHPQESIVLFAKYPTPGKIKTRLAKDLGEEQAATLAMAFVQDMLAKMKRYAVYLSSPDNEDKALFSEQFPQIPYYQQRGNNLGERMYHTMIDQLKTYKKVLIIGSDVPHLPLDVVEQAFSALDHAHVVLGPATDGGYYLIGMKEPHQLFSNITWSTDAVFQRTIEHIEQQQLTTSVLPEMTDVDTLQDLKKVQADLRKEAPATYEVITALQQS